MKHKLISFLILIIFIFCACRLFAAGSLPVSGNPAKENTKVISEKNTGEKASQHEEGEKGEHISHDHEKLELFHAEYYSMPWRSKQTQKDLWYVMVFLVIINLFFLIVLRRKIRSKYKIG